jgi:hypothetical protein
MTPAALEELLAPIALYPDALLGVLLSSATHPQEVMDGGNWLLQQKATGEALDSEAEKAGFGPSMRALMQFPTVVDMMCQNFDWTQQLGSAMNTDQAAVLAAVQRLRGQAMDAGNLKSSPQMKVSTQVVEKQKVVVVESPEPQVVYVPQYDPQTVYQPAVATTVAPAPTAAEKSGPSTGDVIAAGIFGFAAGAIVANIFELGLRRHVLRWCGVVRRRLCLPSQLWLRWLGRLSPGLRISPAGELPERLEPSGQLVASAGVDAPRHQQQQRLHQRQQPEQLLQPLRRQEEPAGRRHTAPAVRIADGAQAGRYELPPAVTPDASQSRQRAATPEWHAAHRSTRRSRRLERPERLPGCPSGCRRSRRCRRGQQGAAERAEDQRP